MIGYAIGDGLTDLESRHWQIVELTPVRNGLGPDTRDWTTLPAYRERIERARRDRCLTKTKGQNNEVAK
jgi:hypothetical protein